MHKCILRYFKQGGMKVVNWKNKLLLIELCVRPRTVWQTWLTFKLLHLLKKQKTGKACLRSL